MENLYGIPGRPGAFEMLAQNKMYGGTPEDQFSEDQFWYPVEFLNLAAGATARGTVTIQKDSDFEWLLGSQFSWLTAAGAVTEQTIEVPLVTVEIVDGGSGRNLTSGAVPIWALFGDGRLPHVLAQPRIFKATSTINFNVTNVSAATAYNMYLVMEGVKIFNYNLRRSQRQAMQAAAMANGAQ